MNVLAKILTLCGMISTVAWFFWNPVGWIFQWEPIVVFLLSLAGFVATENTRHTSLEKVQCHSNDKRLFTELLEVLPSKTIIEFLKQHDFLVDFQLDDLNPVRTFHIEWDNAEHEFLDEELENIRKALMDAAIDLRNKISKYTSPNQGGFQAVRSDRLKHNERHEERFRKEAGIINEAADVFVEAHQKLVRAGVKKCKI